MDFALMKKLITVFVLLATPAIAQQKTFNITLTEQQLQTVGHGLVKLPYEESAALIAEIQKQIAPPVAPPKEPKQNPPPE